MTEDASRYERGPSVGFVGLGAMGAHEGYDTLRELAGPGSHLVPGHDAEVMARYPRVDGPAGDFAVEIR